MRDFRLGGILRKHTTPVHWALGVLWAIVAVEFFPAVLALMGVNAGNQIWNDKEEQARDPTYKMQGCSDWWESYLVFCILFSIALILHLSGVVTIRWI